jgi:hypothetical protein
MRCDVQVCVCVCVCVHTQSNGWRSKHTSALLVDGGVAPSETFFGLAHPAPPDAAIKFTDGSSPKFSFRIEGRATCREIQTAVVVGSEWLCVRVCTQRCTMM